MSVAIIQLVTSFLGSLGFAILFRVQKPYLLVCGLGGVLSWGVYLLGVAFGQSIFVATLLASAFSALYSEFLARRKKAPAILFFIPTIIPLVPGSNLYYMLNGLAMNDYVAAKLNAVLLLEYASGIALGISIVWAELSMQKSVREERFGRNKNEL